MSDYKFGQEITVSNEIEEFDTFFIKDGQGDYVVVVSEEHKNRYLTGYDFKTVLMKNHRPIETRPVLRQALRDYVAMKLKISSPGQSEELQNIMFEEGYRWCGGGKNIDTEWDYIFTKNNVITGAKNIKCFNKRRHLEYSPSTDTLEEEKQEYVPYTFEDDLLGMKYFDNECKRKVLVTTQTHDGVQHIQYWHAMKDWIHLDGTPFGKKVGE